MNSNITFITSFIKIYEGPVIGRSLEWRINYFRDILSTGIQICIYISPEYEILIKELLEEYKNLKIMKVLDIKDTWCYKTYKSIEGVEMPEVRHNEKDVPEYNILMNSKIEYVYDTIIQNPFNTTHFSWIDFNISHIFKDRPKILNYLRVLSQRTFVPSFLTIPGCWSKLNKDNVCSIINNISWRFCGGFFMGDKQSLINFYNLYMEHFPVFLNEYKKNVWEVNFWAYLECFKSWNPTWFHADHNDSIIQIPTNLYSYSVQPYLITKIHDYPEINTYYSTSASYIYYDNKHILNTRFVNYWLFPNGCYLFLNKDKIIENKNMCSILDDDLNPITYNVINENIYLSFNSTAFSQGLEDMRLYEYKGQLKFIATTVNYFPADGSIPNNKCRMIVGDYDYKNNTVSNAEIIGSPYDAYLEKNWAPINGNNEELFIYKWWPLEIGVINYETKKLDIKYSHDILNPLFSRVKGSTPFIQHPLYTDYLIGLVHISEEGSPRNYFNMLILLEKETLKPFKYTETFYFKKLGVEFSIGMTILNNCYKFWISQHDRDTLHISIALDKIPFLFDF